MTLFSFTAMGSDGQKRAGTLEAESPGKANEILLARGDIPLKVTVQRSTQTSAFMQRINQALHQVKTRDLILFTRQFGTMMRVGVPAGRLFRVLEEQTDNEKMKAVIMELSQSIKEGKSYHEAFQNHPDVFSPLYCSMLHAGEVSGTIPDVLNRLIYLIEHDLKLKTEVKSALQYPKFVLAALVVSFIVLLVVVFPKFARIYKNAGLNLPIPTKICMLLSEMIIHNWYWLIGAGTAITVASVLYLRTDRGRYKRDVIMLSLPIIGNTLQKTAISRFTSIFAIMQASGMHILESMKVLRGTIGNEAFAVEFDKITDQLAEGQGIAGPLREAKYFTPMLVNMIAIGEETGNMVDMLNEVSVHYDAEVDYALKKMIGAIGPTLTILLAVVVSFFALAIYLPMWDLIKIVK